MMRKYESSKGKIRILDKSPYKTPIKMKNVNISKKVCKEGSWFEKIKNCINFNNGAIYIG
jgi:hypothetical protein